MDAKTNIVKTLLLVPGMADVWLSYLLFTDQQY
jgi:hypothetical protein